MRERLRHFGGELAITSNQRGTRISVRVPAPVAGGPEPPFPAEVSIPPALPA